MRAAKLLEQAGEKIYDFGCQDSSDVVAKLNLRYGLGKILYVLNKHKVDTENVFCVTTPDSGITRNKERWQAGFSYGCLLRWPSEKQINTKFVFPQIKPNACGMLVAKLDKEISQAQLFKRLEKISKKGLKVNGCELILNIGNSNHFIEVCRVEETATKKLTQGDIVTVIHTSPSEFKTYLYDLDFWKSKGGYWSDTPLGPLFVLQGKSAKKYLKKYKEIEQFSIDKREHLVKSLFGDFEVISNATHQGIFDDNEVRLGLYKFKDEEELVPVTFRWDIHVYLLKPQVNLDSSFLGHLNISDSNKEILTSLNMLPHGGGYELPFEPYNWSILNGSEKRLFQYNNNGTELIFSSPSEMPYYYRGTKIIEEIKRLKLGSVAAKLKQIYTLKY